MQILKPAYLGLFLGLALAGCRTGTPVDVLMPAIPPNVTGFPGTVPSGIKSTLVWGNDERAVNTTITWLQGQGQAVYDPAAVQGLIARNLAKKDNGTLIDQAAVLDAARETGVDAVAFADRVGESLPAMVSVRAIEVDSGRVIWSGSARFDSSDQWPANDALSFLTERALEAAWGVRPQGS